MFTGYIDESGSTESQLFTLSCLVGWGGEWFWFEQAWINLLEKKNKLLAAQGRKELSRYHAADCSSSLDEFADWTKDEQKEFTAEIVNIFRRHALIVASYTINLKELEQEIPEAKSDPRGFAYVLLLRHLMIEVGQRITTRKEFSNDHIALIHDRCDYNAALLQTFNQMKADTTFRYRDYFSTITPMSWEDCIPLQAADLLAYENFKEAESKNTKRNRRKTLEFLLDLRTFGGCGKFLGKDWLQEYKKVLEEIDESTKKALAWK
jgi:hypothetical protein